MFAWVLILIAWVAVIALILHDVTKDDAAGSAVVIAARKLRALTASAITRARRFQRACARAIARARAARQAAIAAAAAAAAESAASKSSSADAPLPNTPSPETASAETPSPDTAFAESTLPETAIPVTASPDTAPPEAPTPEPTSWAGPAAAEEPAAAEPASPETAPLAPVPPEPVSLVPMSPETPQQVVAEVIRLAPAADPAQKRKWWRSQNDRAAKTIPELESAITNAVRSAAPDCGNFVGVIVRQKTPKSRQDVNWELQGIRFGKADKKLVNDALPGIVKQMQQEFRVTDHH